MSSTVVQSLHTVPLNLVAYISSHTDYISLNIAADVKMARFLVFLKCFFCADVTAILATLTYIVLKLDESFCDKL